MARKSRSAKRLRCLTIADAGHLDSKTMVGLCYEKGCGVKQDKNKAIRCYREAAEFGHVSAQFHLASCYYFGSHTDEQHAVEWYRKAAENGHASAQLILAVFLLDGTGTAKDEKQAFEWLCKAAAQDNVDALSQLGNWYQAGKGCEKDEKNAVKCFHRAAEIASAHPSSVPALAAHSQSASSATAPGQQPEAPPVSAWLVTTAAAFQDLDCTDFQK